MEDEISKIAKEKYDKTRKVLKNTSIQELYSKLLKLGFKYIEEEDEDNAKPLNARQKIIAKYFDGKSGLSSEIIQSFILEIEDKETNYPHCLENILNKAASIY